MDDPVLELGPRQPDVVVTSFNVLDAEPPENEHAGDVLLAYLDVEKTGLRELQISMRENGAEMDKIVLALDEAYIPQGSGPEPKTKILN